MTEHLPRIEISNTGIPLLICQDHMLHYLTDTEWNAFLKHETTSEQLEKEFKHAWTN